MAPERLLGEEYDGKADVYSVGVMAYRMLSGEMPYPRNRGLGLMVAAVMRSTREPTPLREAYPALSTDLERVVMHALAREPALRPSVKEFGAAFAAAAEKERGQEAPSPPESA